MKLGLMLGISGASDPAGTLELTHEAERLGYSSVWAAEAYGYDAATVLAWLAGQTSAIDLGSAILQIPGRTPAMTAMTAAGLNALSNGRFRLGVGVSGPQVSEGWHGVPFKAPLGRTREYVKILTLALSGQPVQFDGRHFQLPLPTPEAKALRSAAKVRDIPPIYLAAVGPKNLELAGEIADGWLGVFFSPEQAELSLGPLRSGRPGGSLDGFDVVPTVPVALGPDTSRCADLVRGYTALYVGGMGSRENNFYNALAHRLGFAQEADTVQNLYLAKQHREAAAAVPEDLIRQTSLVGGDERVIDRLQAYAQSGVTTLAVSLFNPTQEGKLNDLRHLAELLDHAGVA
ncbi:LLM class F420-dependent oxidoreductase [Saxibacter everestensis]|uniref:LLM class F420-dependent oxidoreductase n=1 Tax=Saxibacter everestensis TaxID=2909229 RepID=A0ABY8QZ50_9MICO|nr:LLM class F420-dependent oxidoreductase [Brevibacteriaceae bacterium ZFBP1038]